MSTTSDRLFAACASPTLQVHRLPDQGVHALTRSFRQVERIAREEDCAEKARPHLSRVKAARFVLAASPVHGADGELRLSGVAARLGESEIQLSWSCSARLVEAFRAVRPHVVDLSRTASSPLQSCLWELLAKRRSGQNLGIVVPDFGVKVKTDSWMKRADLGAIPVLTPSALRGAEHYDELFIFGPPRWYVSNSGEFLFSTPRASVQHVIGYRWTDLSLVIEPVFRRVENGAQPRPGASEAPVAVVIIEDTEPDAQPIEPDDEAGDFTIDVDSILERRRARSIAVGDADDEEVEARLVLLAGGEAVLLPWTDDAKSFRADFRDQASQKAAEEEDEDAGRVRRHFNKELEVGDFIVLRTGSGGDLLPKVADGVMGAAAATHRLRQREWKLALRSEEHRHGGADLCARLRAMGATHASISNIHNWVRERTIRPDSDEDFEAVLKVLGLGGRRTEFLATAETIHHAHRSAGFRIRKLLMTKVRQADLRALRSTGRMEFHLEELSTQARMTAYRIERIVPIAITARSHELNDVFIPEND